MQLIIGTKAWSSWSLRPWLVMVKSGAAFDELRVALRWEGASAAIAAVSPSKRVPVLRDGDLVIWDSLAISEYLAERFPKADLWPKDASARAIARAAAAEMHSGFGALRETCPMDLALRKVQAPDEATSKDLRRMVELVRTCRAKFGASGPFLVGGWSIADAFLTPVATRIRSYGLDLAAHGDDGVASAYFNTLLVDPDYLRWELDAINEAVER